MHIARLNQPAHGFARIAVKGERRAHHPHDAPVLALMGKQVVKLGIVLRIGGFAAAAAAEGEGLLQRVFRGKAVRMEINALFSILRAAVKHHVALFKQPEFADDDAPVFKHGYAVHAALLRKQPLPVYLHVFGVDAHGVEIVRRDAVARRRQKQRIRCADKAFFCKIRCGICAKREHTAVSFAVFLNYTICGGGRGRKRKTGREAGV